MSRYIDADAISRKYVIAELSDLADEFSELDENELHSERWCGITDAKQVVVNAPSIDIVRCGECKYNYNTAINHGKMQPRCDFTDYKLTENDYCSRGEREGE